MKRLNIFRTYNAFEKLIAVAFLFTTFSGAVRKWGTTNGLVSNIILMIQLLMPIMIFIFFSSKVRKTVIIIPFIIYFSYLLICAFNPMNNTTFHGLIGVVIHSSFWSILLVCTANRRDIDYNKLMPLFVFVCLLQTLLAITQYLLPDTHILNRYVKIGEVEGIAKVGFAVRVTGTFSYISGYSAYVLFTVFLAWYIAVNQNSNRSLQFIILGSALLGGLMNGSRSVIASVLLFTILMFISTNQITRLVNGLIFPLLIFTIPYLYSPQIHSFVNNAFDNFMVRVNHGQVSGEQMSRVLGPLYEVIYFKGKYPVFGIGLGATYQGANSIWGESWYAKEYGGYEEEAERVILEGGWVLFVLRIFMFITLAYYIKVPSFSFFVIAVTCIFFIPIIFNIYNSIYLAIGLVMLDNAYFRKQNTLAS